MQLSRQSEGHGRPYILAANSLSNDVSTSVISKSTDTNISSTSDDVQPFVASQITTSRGKGRGAHLKGKNKVSDPHLTTPNLTGHQVKPNVLPSQSKELGTIGHPIEIRVNYYSIVQLPTSGLIYQYHIQIQTKEKFPMSRIRRRQLYESWVRQFCEKNTRIERSKIVFDNQNIIFTYDQPLPDIDETGITEKVMGPYRENSFKEYEILIKQVGNPIDLSSLMLTTDINIKLDNLQNIRQVLSIVLHEQCSSKATYIYDRSFFQRPVSGNQYDSWDLGLGKAAWRGFYSCLVFTQGIHRLVMNLDVSYRIFMKEQPFIDFLCEVMRHSPYGKSRYSYNQHVQKVEMEDVLEFLDPSTSNIHYSGEIDFLLEQCMHLPVRSHVANKTINYVVQGFGEAALTQSFEWNTKDGKEMTTVFNYYEEKYGIELKYPTLPVLAMRNGSFVPMELVDVKEVRMKKITDEQRACLCLISSLKPCNYLESINEIRHNREQQYFEQDPFVAAWNLNVSIEMLTVPARILPMPDIIYTDNHCITHAQCRLPGVWNDTNIPFHHPMGFPSVWALINLSPRLNKELCKIFYNELSNVAAAKGIQCPEPVIYEEYNVEEHSVSQAIAELTQMKNKNDDCKFFMVILPENKTIRDRIYGDLKKLCELESGFGIITQMIQTSKKGDRYQWSYSKLNSILQKINIKLNGTNSILHVHDNIREFFSKGHRIMYVGVDLSHSAPGSRRKRSTVAVVASADNIPNRYFKEIYVQERLPETRRESCEYIVDMKLIMESLISQYEKHRHYFPNAIIIYRDGISNSEFDTVFVKELTAIREACVTLLSNYQPYLTYIVVNKRHHTRFFPTDRRDNVTAGTVIDSRDVTNSATYNFFLNSHHAQKGTSRPTHYHVLYDDNKLKADEIQMLTYALCYTYARCTRSISIPAPVKYADLLAFRAGIYININDDSNIESNTSESATRTDQNANVNSTIKSTRIVLSSQLIDDCLFFI